MDEIEIENPEEEIARLLKRKCLTGTINRDKK